MAEAAGQTLGRAQGSIEIDLRDLDNVSARVRRVSGEVERELGRISVGAQQAEAGFGGLNRAATMVGATLAGFVSMKTAAMGVELARTAARADQMAQRFGFLANIAGQSADDMLAALQKASRGHIANTDLMFAANRAMLLGVADTTEEMETLMRIAGARAGAMGMTLTQAFDDMVVGIGRLSPRILDNLGIILDSNTVYTAYAASIGKSVEQLTEAERRQAFYNAVVDQSRELVEQHTSAGVSAAGRFQQMEAAAANAKIALGQVFAADVVQGATDLTGWLVAIEKALKRISENQVVSPFRGLFDVRGTLDYILGRGDTDTGRALMLRDTERQVERLTAQLEKMNAELAAMEDAGSFDPRDVERYRTEIRLVESAIQSLNQTQSMLTARSSAPTPAPLAGGNAPGQLVPDALRLDAVREMERVSADAARQRVDIERQYGQQRAQIVANYGLSMARAEEDFGRQRARAAQQLAQNIANLQAESAARQAQMARDLEEKLADIRAQSAKRVGDWQADHEERIAKLREDAGKRAAAAETEYQRNRERAAEGHRESLLSAAGRLDAAAVAAEQRRYALEQREAARAHQERTQQEQAGLDERIAQEQAAHAQRLAREARDLADRIAQEQRSHAKRLADARDADAKRLADMQTAFDEQQAREDEDRRIRLTRQAEDHRRQLAQMDATHGERMAQIKRQEADRLKEIEKAHLEELRELGLHNEAWSAIQDAQQRESLKKWDEWWKEFQKRFEGAPWPTPQQWDGYASGGPVRRTGPALVHGGEFVLNRDTTAALHSVLGGFDQRSLVGAVGNRSTSLVLSEGAITIHAAPGQSGTDIAWAVRREMVNLIEELAA